MKKRLFSVLAIVCSMALVLVGCGGSGEAGSAADASANFVGTWTIDGVSNSDGDVTGDDLDIYKALGIYLTLEEDGGATLEMFGIELPGSWEASSATTAILRLSDEDAEEADIASEQEVQIVDGKLVLKDDEDTMTFVQIDPSEKTSSDLGSLITEGLESLDLEGSDGNSALSDAKDLDITVADDEVCTIKVTGVGDYYGDPGYLVSVTNKTDAEIEVDDQDAFNVGGKEVGAVFSMTVDADSDDEEILWFENSDLDDEGVDALKDVTGKIVVTDPETDEVLGTYDFAA